MYFLSVSQHHLQPHFHLTVHPCSGEECNMEGFTFDTRAEDLRHVWIPLTLKMSISKSQGLEISSWPEGEEVSLYLVSLTVINWVFIVA